MDGLGDPNAARLLDQPSSTLVHRLRSRQVLVGGVGSTLGLIERGQRLVDLRALSGPRRRELGELGSEPRYLVHKRLEVVRGRRGDAESAREDGSYGLAGELGERVVWQLQQPSRVVGVSYSGARRGDLAAKVGEDLLRGLGGAPFFHLGEHIRGAGIDPARRQRCVDRLPDRRNLPMHSGVVHRGESGNRDVQPRAELLSEPERLPQCPDVFARKVAQCGA